MQYLREFLDLKTKNKKKVFTPATTFFCVNVEVTPQKRLFLRLSSDLQKTIKRDILTYRPGHGFETGTVPAKPGRMVSLFVRPFFSLLFRDKCPLFFAVPYCPMLLISVSEQCSLNLENFNCGLARRTR